MNYKELITEKNFGHYANPKKVVLTEAEKASTPYAPFIDMPINLPSEENIMALLPDHMIDPADAISPLECKKLFTPERQKCENGYCICPEGYGFSAVNVKMPKVTPEMLDWWFSWYPENPVHYMIWLPDFHVNSSVGSVACEDLGWGEAGLDRRAGTPLNPKEIGIDNPLESDPEFLRFFGSGMHILKADGSDAENPLYMTMVNYIRRFEEGIEFKIRVWMGVKYQDGEILKETCDCPVPLVTRTRMMACHNAWEWSRMSELLPKIYQFAKEQSL